MTEKWINRPLTYRLADMLGHPSIVNNDEYWRTVVEAINELSHLHEDNTELKKAFLRIGTMNSE